MPVIQNAGQPVLAPQVQAQQPGALGSVGNLRFKGEPGATPRASSPSVFQSAGNFLSKLAFYCTASPQARGQQFVRDRNETNTRAFGDLLGRLTAPAGGKNELSAVASDLARLADLIHGDIARMPGGKEGVRAHLQGLSMLDLGALNSGVLSQPGARDAVLAMVSPGLRESAGVVLDQLMQSLDARVAGQALAQPLADAVKALGAQPADSSRLGAALDHAAYGLHALGGASQDKVNAYVRDLPDDMLRTLTQSLVPDGKLVAPGGLSDSQRDTLALVGRAVQREGQTRLDAFSATLAQHLSSDEPPDNADVLKACRERVDKLGMGSSSAVLLKALSLPVSLTGLSDQRAGEVLTRLSQPLFNDVFRAFESGTDPAQGRAKRLLEPQQAMRREAAESRETAAFTSLQAAMSGTDHGKVSLFANNYKAAANDVRETGSSRVISLPEAMCQQLSDQFGVQIDPDARDVTTTLQADVRGPLTQQLEAPVPGLSPGTQAPGTREAVVPVNGQNRTFIVDEVFHKDAVERIGLSLSVSGTDAGGNVVNTPWQGGASLDGRPERVGQALDSLERVAGPMAKPLTHLMNQQFCAGMLIGLQIMDQNSPFKLSDGSVVLPVGGLSMDFNVDKQADGSFRIGMTMHGPLSNVVKMDANGSEPVRLDPESSWVEMTVSLSVSADGSTVREAEAPRTRHNFTMLSE